MRQSDRKKISEIEAFRTDLVRFRQMLEAKQEARRRYGIDDRDRTGDVDALHESLLRRQGTVEPLCDRVVGIYTHAGWTIWDVALHDHGPFNQAYMVGQLTGYVTTLLGRLEADPSLLRPPKPSSETTPPRSVLQPINIYGGTVNIAQTGTGDISQHIMPQEDLAEVRGLLTELEAAIRDVQAPDDEVEGFLEPVEQLNSELGKPRPLISRLTRSWGAIQAIAAVEGAWQNWDRVQRIAAELGPKAHDLIQVLARGSGSG